MSNRGKKPTYSVVSLAELLAEGSSADALWQQINSIYNSFPLPDDPGNEFGPDDKWRRLFFQMPEYVQCLLRHSTNVVGYWSCFPVTDSLYRRGVAGENIDIALETEDLAEVFFPGEYLGYFHAFYVPECHLNFSTRPLLFKSIISFMTLMARKGYFFRKILSNSASLSSVKLVAHAGFERLGFHSSNRMLSSSGEKVPTEVYEIDFSKKQGFVNHDRTLSRLYSEYFGLSHGDFSSDLKKLDDEIEAIELSVRELIASRLGDDAGLLPSHIRENIELRIASEIKKHPDAEVSHLKTIRGMLEFADLTELQGVIVNKSLYGRFKGVFPVKEILISEFVALAALRNGVRHTRSVSDIARLKGQAAIRYFSALLPKTKSRSG